MCFSVRKTHESGPLVVLSMRQYRLLLNKYGLSMSHILGNWTLGNAHTHTGLSVYMFTALGRGASVLILIYGLD